MAGNPKQLNLLSLVSIISSIGQFEFVSHFDIRISNFIPSHIWYCFDLRISDFEFPTLRFRKRPKRLHVLHIFLQLFAFRRFEHLGDSAEAAVAHDEAKCVQADPAFPNVFVPIDAGAARCFRIVQVQRDQALQPDDAIEFSKHSFG